MRIEINTVRFDLSPQIKKYIEEKIGSVSRVVKKFEADGEVTIFVELSRSTRHHKNGEEVYYAEATLRLPKKTIRAECTNEDAYAAIDAVKDMVKEDVAKFKDLLLKKERPQKK